MTQTAGKDVPIILASGSPRRKALLESLSVPFEVIVPNINEDIFQGMKVPPDNRVKQIGLLKGKWIAEDHKEALVIAGDTIVIVDEQVLGKPKSSQEAFQMLSTLQGREHSVFSSIAVFYQDQSCVEALETKVTMLPLTSQQIWKYIETGEPRDKAGAYGIQGVGSTIVERVDGCYFNVVGMSMMLLNQLTRDLGITLMY